MKKAVNKIGQKAYVVPTFWICNCKGFNLCINGLEECEQCGAKQKDARPADLSLFLEHAGKLPENRVQEVFDTMMNAKEHGMFLHEILQNVAEEIGFNDDDSSGQMIELTTSTTVWIIVRLLQEGFITLPELTGENFEELLSFICNNIEVDWDDTVRALVGSWQDSNNTKSQNIS